MSTMSWIRQIYNVPAYRGVRVVYSGDGSQQFGTVTQAAGQYLRIRLDGEREARRYHPTWELQYLGRPAEGKEVKP